MSKKNNKKEVAKKAIAGVAALSVIAGIGATIGGNAEEAQARNRKPSSSSSQTTEESTSSVKRPGSNANKDESTSSTKSKRSSAYSSSSRAGAKRVKGSVKAADTVKEDGTSSYSEAKEQTKTHKSVADKKANSKASKNKTSSYSKGDKKGGIVVSVSTNK